MLLTVKLGDRGSDFFTASIIDSDFHRRWLDELEWCNNNCLIDQLHTFSCFKDTTQLQKILVESTDCINKFLKHEFISIPKKIDWDDQEWYNELHLKFEQLSGKYSKPTRLFAIAPKVVKEAIRNLNCLIHTVESKNKDNMFYLIFDKNSFRRQPLQSTDYELFDLTEQQLGSLYLGYCELGKNYLDLYKDNLPLNYPGAKNLHYYSGEFFILLDSVNQVDLNAFVTWLKANNVDIEDKKLGIGRIKLGHLDQSVEHVQKILKKHQHIHSITIERN